MTHLIDNIFAVEVPEDTVVAEIHDKESLPLAIIAYVKDPNGWFKPGYPVPIYQLPPGNWQLLFLSNEVMEGQAAMVFPSMNLKDGRFYKNYLRKDLWDLKSSILSFHSLLKSKNLTGNFAIVEKIK